jgi:hypothetical protein
MLTWSLPSMRMAYVSVEHSRSIKLAEQVSTSKGARLQQHLEASHVVVSVDAQLPQAQLTTRVLLTTLRRGPGTLTLVADGLTPACISELEAATAAIDADHPLRIVRRGKSWPDRAIAVHVGPNSSYAVIRIVPEGHGAHVASAATAVIRPQRAPSPLGAIYAAALGAAEVFKHSARVINSRRVLQRHLTFCPVSLSRDLAVAPDLPTRLTLDMTLIGVGAIGTGIVLLLDALGADGRLVAVDRQRYARENLGTYSLGGITEVSSAPWKVDIAQRALPRFDVTPVPDSIDKLIRSVDAGETRWSPTVLTALDSAEARRDAQRLWPDRLIDAATGDTMLGLHDHRYGVDPCLWCVFPVNRGVPSGADAIAQRLGLDVLTLADADAVLTEEHLEGKSEEQLTLLRPLVGTPMCGLAQATGLTSLDADGYMPSVPFVSLQAASLSVGRLIAAFTDCGPPVNLVQYDGLFGPQAATLAQMRRRPECICSERRSTIERVRALRRESGPGRLHARD